MQAVEPYNYAQAYTASNTVPLPIITQQPCRALYIGGTGDLTVVWPDTTTTLISAVPVGTILAISPVRINSTGTTATGLVALFRI